MFFLANALALCRQAFPVLHFFTDREHIGRILRPFFSAALILALAACSRPVSYEQFIKAEDAPAGIYEFAIPSSIFTSSASPAAAAPKLSAVPGPTYNISIYTAPLEKALLLDILWIAASSEDLQHFPSKMPQVPFEKGGPGAIMPENAAGTPKKDTTCSKSDVLCDRSEWGRQIILRESVWFPAGEHRALYRSGVSLGVREEDIVERPATPGQGEGPFRDGVGGMSSSRTETASGILLQIRPINPPETFRGLGIICKQNDGTR